MASRAAVVIPQLFGPREVQLGRLARSVGACLVLAACTGTVGLTMLDAKQSELAEEHTTHLAMFSVSLKRLGMHFYHVCK